MYNKHLQNILKCNYFKPHVKQLIKLELLIKKKTHVKVNVTDTDKGTEVTDTHNWTEVTVLSGIIFNWSGINDIDVCSSNDEDSNQRNSIWVLKTLFYVDYF